MQGLQSRLPFPVVTARLSLTYGPAQSESFLIPSLIRHCLAGEPSTIRHPSARRDLIFVDDVVEALCRLPYADLRGGEVVNIASGNAPTMRETVTEILAATGADSANVEFPMWKIQKMSTSALRRCWLENCSTGMHASRWTRASNALLPGIEPRSRRKEFPDSSLSCRRRIVREPLRSGAGALPERNARLRQRCLQRDQPIFSR